MGWEIFKWFVVVAFLFGMSKYAREHRYLGKHYRHLRDSVYQEMIRDGGVFDIEAHRHLVDSLQGIELDKLGY